VAHLYGNAAPVPAIRDALHGLPIAIIDDAAQGLGRDIAGKPIGSWGEFGVIASGPMKPIAGSAGGVLLTNDEESWRYAASLVAGPEKAGDVLRRVASFWLCQLQRRWTLPFLVLWNRFSSQVESESNELVPLSNAEAAVNLRQMARIRECVFHRRQNAEAILDALPQLRSLCVTDLSADGLLTALTFVLPPLPRIAQQMASALARDGIECQSAPLPCHLLDPQHRPNLPCIESVYSRILRIPLESSPRSLQNTQRLVARLIGPAARDMMHDEVQFAASLPGKVD
jgi:dTDP-4-amino-4,6-dideoxygalactose transaminase